MERPCGRTELGMLKEQAKGLRVQGRLVKEMSWREMSLDFIQCGRKPLHKYLV